MEKKQQLKITDKPFCVRDEWLKYLSRFPVAATAQKQTVIIVWLQM